MDKKTKLIVHLSSIFLISTAMIVADVFAGIYSELLTAVLTPVIVDKNEIANTHAKGAVLSELIESEGIVMVKNDGVLPLSKSVRKVNVFGRGSTDWIVSGSGSGQVREDSADVPVTDFLGALKEYGITYNTNLSSFYTRYQSPMGYGNTLELDYDDVSVLCEPDIEKNEYSASLLNGAKSYSDTAFVIISRRAGESEDPLKYQNKLKGKGRDYSRTYLEISTEEESLLKYVGANYENVVVLINSTNVMELTFMDTIPGLDACLIVGPTGANGALAIPDVIYGDVSPSGRLADTYAYELESALTYANSGLDGANFYTNSNDMYPTTAKYGLNSGYKHTRGVAYLDYVEGIYIGYKWYETADAEGVFDNVPNKFGKGAGYNSVVQYPFGYGLSYSSFSWNVTGVHKVEGDSYTAINQNSSLEKDDKIQISVSVTNTGNMTAKDVVELYVTVPYYDGGIEKSHVSLVDFAKTNDIKPNESETVTLSFYLQDIASYDAYDSNNNDFKGYELDAGEYQFKLSKDAHNINQVTFGNDNKLMDGVLTYNIPETIKYETSRSTGAQVKNLFTGEDAVDGLSLDGSDSNANINFVSRSNFPQTVAKTEPRSMSDKMRQTNLYAGKNITDKSQSTIWDNSTKNEFGETIDNGNINFNVSNNLMIGNGGKPTELGYSLGKDYNDPRWEEVMEQISIEEAATLVSNGLYGNGELRSIGKPALRELDGPIQLGGFMPYPPYGTGFPSTVVLATTWSKKLAHDFGLNLAIEMGALNMDGVYGPSTNIHRSPFSGRNYEYYSEDPILTGLMVGQCALGIKQGGKYGYLKHFSLYEMESERDGIYTWLTEQTLREIYMKPFQIVVESGYSSGIMTGYGRVGNVWSGGSIGLITGLLKREWGFHGGIVTDWSDNHEYMLSDQALRAGGNLGMNAPLNFTYNNNSSPRIKARLKEAAKELTYMWLHAHYTNQQYNLTADVTVVPVIGQQSWVWWKPVVIDLNILVFSGLLIWACFIVREHVLLKEKRGDENESQ